ncbi:hypothetical protein Calkr_2155 [Caldicellulosiruptor acetigenus I77R1B]|uniref:Uncharacterized protein n=1 Tax=Caldicellulosiruptor acetigenus (strain ATCC 700853 / DSM 12137 / I77R1B) TaxID=632335 RepID=E4S5W0_CALA7|nr:hypothetical protein [Caldicellulosiruptor acetigenus]ADQ41620.1 hypothetical protein Calkr_2155 [Caldicellulosiruptor acetigenus I77R1B]
MNLIQKFCSEVCPYGDSEEYPGCRILKMLNNDERCPAWLLAKYLRQKVSKELDTGEEKRDLETS